MSKLKLITIKIFFIRSHLLESNKFDLTIELNSKTTDKTQIFQLISYFIIVP